MWVVRYHQICGKEKNKEKKNNNNRIDNNSEKPNKTKRLRATKKRLLFLNDRLLHKMMR